MYSAILSIAALCLLLTSPVFAHGSYVYISNYGDGTLSQFREDSDGRLTPLNPPTVKAYIRCHSLAVARGHYLYVTSARDWRKRDCLISQFRILPNGRLKPLSPPQVFVPDTPASVVVEPSGRFAYVFNQQGTISQMQIRADGRLGLLPTPVIKIANAGGITPNIGFDKSHHILYGSYIFSMLYQTMAGTFAFVVGHDGQLTPLTRSSTYSNSEGSLSSLPISISLLPNGRYAYVPKIVHPAPNASQWREVVAQYRTLPDGGLIPLSPATVPTEGNGHGLIDPAGHFFYQIYQKTDATHETAPYRLGHASIHSNGTLGKFAYQTLDIQADSPPSQDFSLSFDAAGRFCYFCEGSSVYLFRRQANGTVSPFRPRRISAGHIPLGVICVQN